MHNEKLFIKKSGWIEVSQNFYYQISFDVLEKRTVLDFLARKTRSMATFYYCSVNHQSCLQSNKFSKMIICFFNTVKSRVEARVTIQKIRFSIVSNSSTPIFFLGKKLFCLLSKWAEKKDTWQTHDVFVK